MRFDDIELMEINKRFGVAITTKDNFESLLDLDTYLCNKLSALPAHPCPIATAFDRLVQRLAAAGYVTADFTPSTPVAQLLPADPRKLHWDALAQKTGFALPPPRYFPAFHNFARVIFVATLIVPMFPAIKLFPGSYATFFAWIAFVIPSLVIYAAAMLAVENTFSPRFRIHLPRNASTLADLAYALAMHEKAHDRSAWTRAEIWAALQFTFANWLHLNPRRIRRKMKIRDLYAMS